MKFLLIFNHEPYDGTDVTWNGLRLAEQLLDTGQEVRIFLINDAIDLAREACSKPDCYDQDLVQILRQLIKRGALVKVCGTCMSRCGLYKDQPYLEGAEQSTMTALTDWVIHSDRAITF